MISTLSHLTVAAFIVAVGISIPSVSRADTAALLDALRSASEEEAGRIDRNIRAEWSKSGSAAMDLLLRRGREALEEDNTRAAIDHFTALTDHAPDFAEGWHGLARAYYSAEMHGPALDALGRVLTLNPDHYNAMFGLGVLLQQFDDPLLAERAFRAVLDLHPHHEQAKDALENLKREGIGRTL